MSLKRVLAGLIAVYNKLHQLHRDLSTKLDVALSTRASEATLASIKAQTDKLSFDATGNLLTAVNADNVGLAKEQTLSNINSKIPSPTANGNLPVAVAEDQVGVAKEATLQKLSNALASIGTDKFLTKPDNPPNLDVALSTRASEETQLRIAGYVYDSTIRRACSKLLAVIDFSLLNPSDIELGYVIVEGTTNYSIVKWSDEGIPQPEGTGSPYVLKLVVPAGGTVYVRVPLKARYFMPFAAYVSVYNKDYEVEYSFYISLGGYYATATRQKPPKRLRLPANTWGRFITHWFMEAHHGCAEVDIEIYNPQTVDVTVYVGIVTACEIVPHIKAHGLLIGWEGGFYVPLSNETFDWYVNVILPTDIAEVINLWVGMGIQSDDGTTISGEVLFHPGARSLASGSTTTSTTISRDFKVWCGRHGYYGFDTFVLEFKASTTGLGRVTWLQVVLRCWSKENTYQKWFSGSIGAGATVTLVDYWNDDKHVIGGELEITAPTGGSVDVLGATPEGTIVITSVPAGSTKTVKINGRYHYIALRNNDTANQANYSGYLVISQSLLTV